MSTGFDFNRPLLLDGGVRRGSDVAIALALGATAAGIGRPAIWGLAADGEAGVRQVLDRLRDEVSVSASDLLSVSETPGTITPSNTSRQTGTRSGCATHEPSKPSLASRCLSWRTLSSAVLVTSSSRRFGMNAAIPPIANAPRR